MVLLGSTGSIGVNTLLVAQRFGILVEVLVAGKNIALLNSQIAIHMPKRVVVATKEDAQKVNHLHVSYGEEAILNAIEESQSELVVNALVGFLGLRPTLKALACNKRVALANKESLVACGAFIDTSKISPIDSEHFALWYLIQNRPITKMTITASGGAFRDWPIEKLSRATLADTQRHPNWSMGQKITIDSATMVNKIFELLEARWLFGEGTYDAIIETRSLMHAIVDFKDGSSTAHFAGANMQLPIAFALRACMQEQILEHVNLAQVGALEFRAIETQRYAAWRLKDELLQNPLKGTIINAANEVAIEAFCAGQIAFTDISETILTCFEHPFSLPKCSEDVFLLDTEVRAFAKLLMKPSRTNL